MKRSKARAAQTTIQAAGVPLAQGRVPGTLRIPPILLEGDPVEPSPSTTPGGKPAVDSGPAAKVGPSERRELPESYGTSRLLLLARDPRCLYAHWDLSLEQQHRLNQRSADGHLVLRLHSEQAGGPIAAEIQLHAESRHSFVPVMTAGANYVAELGYQDFGGLWVSVATSDLVATPNASVSSDKTARFATMAGAPAIPSGPVASAETNRSIPPPRVSWIPVLGIEPASPATQFFEVNASATSEAVGPESAQIQASSAAPLMDDWTPEQERALSALCGLESPGKVPLSSIDLPRGPAN